MANKMGRRKFLKLTGATALAVSLTGVLSGCKNAELRRQRKARQKALEKSSGAYDEPVVSVSTKIIWKINDNMDGTAVLAGYDDAGEQPMGKLVLPTEWSGRMIVGLDSGLGGKITKLVVPGCYKTVNYYGSDALRELTLQEGVEEVSGFEGCTNLSKVQLPQTLKRIGRWTFKSCQSLTSIDIPSSVEEIADQAFARSGLTEIVLPESVTSCGGWVFGECEDLTRAVIRGKAIGTEMFSGCGKLAVCKMTDAVTEIPGEMFRNCVSLTGIKLPARLTRIGGRAFSGCESLAEIVLPESVTEIEDYAFEKTAITKFVIPDGVKELRWGTFGDCLNLRAVYIPKTLQRIGNYSFSGCTSLTDVYYQAGQEEWVFMEVADDNTMLQAARMHYHASAASMK